MCNAPSIPGEGTEKEGRVFGVERTKTSVQAHIVRFHLIVCHGRVKTRLSLLALYEGAA